MQHSVLSHSQSPLPITSWYGSSKTALKSAVVRDRPIASIIPAKDGSIYAGMYHAYDDGTANASTTPSSIINGKADVALSDRSTSVSITLDVSGLPAW